VAPVGARGGRVGGSHGAQSCGGALAAEKERLNRDGWRAMAEGVSPRTRAGSSQFMNRAAEELTQCDAARRSAGRSREISFFGAAGRGRLLCCP